MDKRKVVILREPSTQGIDNYKAISPNGSELATFFNMRNVTRWLKSREIVWWFLIDISLQSPVPTPEEQEVKDHLFARELQATMFGW